MKRFLFHHGIKNQKWGIRRGPPYPLDRTKIEKGSRLNSVSLIEKRNTLNNRRRWLYTYNPSDDWDAAVYEGPFSIYLRQLYNGMANVYKHKFEILDDLVMPSRQERVDDFIRLFSEENKTAVRDLEVVQGWMKQFGIGSDEARDVNLRKVDNEQDIEAAYEIFNHAMENVKRFTTTKKYASLMAKNYDAMVDDNNKDVYNRVHDPIIIFNPKRFVSEIADAHIVTQEEIQNNFDFVKRELDKHGERVRL